MFRRCEEESKEVRPNRSAVSPQRVGSNLLHSGNRPVLPFHPLLFAAFPILSLYARNIDELSIKATLHPFALALIGALAVWIVAALATREIHKGALIASAAVLAFFSYGHIANT